MRRVILIVLDGCGVGAMPDAAADGGESELASATLPHVAEAVGGLHVPTLQRLGLGNIASICGVEPEPNAIGGWGKMAEASAGKDSVTGHWELMGIVTQAPFPTYPNGFPLGLIADFEAKIGRRTLGNIASSGTAILTQLGLEHMATGKPIVYTSADSVFQVAAHESIVPLEELYGICETAREMLVAPNNVLRVIARPFTGDSPANFRRTENRRDYPLAPPTPNFLTTLANANKTAHAIGVIADLFPGTYFTKAQRTQSNPAHLAAILDAVQNGPEDFVFANCEDFDMLYGHRNDPIGFARCLEAFDAALAAIVENLRPDDLLILTADHGNDPTTASTDHSREYVPVLVHGGGITGSLGTRSTFAYVAAIASDWIGIEYGKQASTGCLS
ncbi:MAG: phosphopentomutase [Janthinobacterium lividum]